MMNNSLFILILSTLNLSASASKMNCSDPAKKSEHPMSTAWSSLYLVGFCGALLNSFVLYVGYGERQTFIRPVSAMIWLVGY